MARSLGAAPSADLLGRKNIPANAYRISPQREASPPFAVPKMVGLALVGPRRAVRRHFYEEPSLLSHDPEVFAVGRQYPNHGA